MIGIVIGIYLWWSGSVQCLFLDFWSSGFGIHILKLFGGRRTARAAQRDVVASLRPFLNYPMLAGFFLFCREFLHAPFFQVLPWSFFKVKGMEVPLGPSPLAKATVALCGLRESVRGLWTQLHCKGLRPIFNCKGLRAHVGYLGPYSHVGLTL